METFLAIVIVTVTLLTVIAGAWVPYVLLRRWNETAGFVWFVVALCLVLATGVVLRHEQRQPTTVRNLRVLCPNGNVIEVPITGDITIDCNQPTGEPS